MDARLLALLALLLAVCHAARTIDVVTPVAGKDATIYRFNLRHILKHVQGLRNVYVVCRPTNQMKSIVLQANEKFVKPGQEVVLVDEAIFPFTFDSIRAYLKANRATEGFDGQPFDATVVVPDVCAKSGPKQSTKEWVHVCRQPFKNETLLVGTELKVGRARVQTFDRTGWILQQFLKLGCSADLVPGIGAAYLVVDADTIFYEDYSPVPPDDLPSPQAYNYMPGDPRDCANPPYFMTLDALGIPNWDTTTVACAGRGANRKCKPQHFCPIAHGMVYSQEVLRSFRTHVEARVADANGQPVQWWQAVLQVMPAWHTSPFSEYITYYAFAKKFFPDTVRVYDEAQMGASHDEIAANYYMGNGLGVSHACHLIEFAAASPADRAHHAGTVGYCDHAKSGKRVDACEFYRAELHGGARCPAPKYESYHGFRNAISPGVDQAFKAFDDEYLSRHATDAQALRVVGAFSGGGGAAAAAAAAKAVPVLRAAAEASAHDAALSALDKKLSGAHGND